MPKRAARAVRRSRAVATSGGGTATGRKPVGLSLHIGLNHVNARQYEGWDDALIACEFDARDMSRIARVRGFTPSVLLTRRATSAAVTAAMHRAAAVLKRGDFFFVTYSGHGGQVPDTNGDELEDKYDETWLLYDREFVDDELYRLWGRFESGVRIFVLSDSCHSGTVVRNKRRARIRASADTAGELAGRKIKALPLDNQEEIYRAHRQMYDKIQKANPMGSRAPVGASVILISGCQDNQTSSDGDRNGLFTEKLLKVWDGGRFKGGYRKLKLAIGQLMPDDQTPNYMTVGLPNPEFEHQLPLTIT